MTSNWPNVHTEPRNPHLNHARKKLSAQGVAQPGAGVGPLLPRLLERDAQGSRDLLVAVTPDMGERGQCVPEAGPDRRSVTNGLDAPARQPYRDRSE